MLSYRSAGESHGPTITAILEGVPAGLRLDLAAIDQELARRQKGFGRGGRMKIETDRVQVLGGLVKGRTTGAPLLLSVPNRDHTLEQKPPMHRPRPGHADLAGAYKFLLKDARAVLERASARETCARVACGGVMRQILKGFGVRVVGFVESIGDVEAAPPKPQSATALLRKRAKTDLHVLDPSAAEAMKGAIRQAAKDGDTLGGAFRVLVFGLPPGLGSYAQWDQKLDGRLAQAVMSIPAIKAVEIGIGFEATRRPGSQVHDEIFWEDGRGPFGGVFRGSGRAGGLEGGVTNGDVLDIRAGMKPISTLRRPLRSIDLRSRKPKSAAFERSDICAVPAASVVGEAMVLLIVGQAFLQKFAADNMEELRASFDAYAQVLRERY